MSVPSWMWHLPILPDTPNATSLPGLEAGPTPPDLPAGPMTESFGLEARPANRSRSREKVLPKQMIGTFGPTTFALQQPEGPLSSWVSRLQQRLARIGSTECLLTWKASATPAGRQLFRLVPSTPRTAATDSGLWPTPTTCMSKGSSPAALTRASGRSRASDRLDHSALAMALWPTPDASGFGAKDPKRLLERRAQCKERTGNGNGFGLTLGQQACLEGAGTESPAH